jgi:hypothetical protein
MPWIFAAARGTCPPEIDLEETGLRFLELLARYQPPEFLLSRARRFFDYFCDNLTWAHYLKTLLHRETDLPGLERVWREYFASNPPPRTRERFSSQKPRQIEELTAMPPAVPQRA